MPMYNAQNLLRLYRKRSGLTIADVAFLMDISNHSIISRYEKGYRTPSIELILMYHVLFDTEMDAFFDSHKERILQQLPIRLKRLIEQLNQNNETAKRTSRTKFLEEVYKRINERDYARA